METHTTPELPSTNTSTNLADSANSESKSPISTSAVAYRWLLVLGFSASEAAAALQPDLFKD